MEKRRNAYRGHATCKNKVPGMGQRGGRDRVQATDVNTSNKSEERVYNPVRVEQDTCRPNTL